MSLHHSCKLRKKNESTELFGKSTCASKLTKYFLISSSNPLNAEYFRSEQSLKAEKIRQINLHKVLVIHPLSLFRTWYEFYLIFLYIANLISKPIDSAFARSQEEMYRGHRVASVILDLLCWIDILMNFNTGFAVKKRNKIELRRMPIAKNYIHSPYFICDVLSSIPRNLPYFFVRKPAKPFLGVINIIGLLKFFRIFTVVELINRLSKYFQMKSTGIRFLFTSILITFLLIHWMSCMQFIVPRLTGRYFYDPNHPFEESWIYQNGIYKKRLLEKYIHCFFKGSSEMLGMRIDTYKIHITSDYFVAIGTYWLGKIIIASIWIILAVAILNARSMELKFLEIVNQLDEYMKQKQLPLNLRDKISKYYDFRYQRIFFKEDMITNLLCANLKREVNIHVCKSLIANVNLFADLPPDQISRLVSRLISEIFLPKDTIIQSGLFSDSMYFVSSGTVAVYSHSGKEICHLQDGAYFGEVSMVVKNQLSVTTVIAIETTQVYRLKRKHFEECLMKNKVVFSKLVADAENWLKIVLKIEDEYKKMLFEQTYATGTINEKDFGIPHETS
nr:potassium/sodium hyperpolarization-activated cyclic nucleotide-gated channel 2-like isoform X1 [Leptinotarsa decemlineata]